MPEHTEYPSPGSILGGLAAVISALAAWRFRPKKDSASNAVQGERIISLERRIGEMSKALSAARSELNTFGQDLESVQSRVHGVEIGLRESRREIKNELTLIGEDMRVMQARVKRFVDSLGGPDI